jgi:L-amino acid N-acyltransferase
MEGLRIRAAREEDLGALNDIYNHYVLHSTATYQTEASTLGERRKWFRDHRAPYVVTVAEREGEAAGWAALSRFHPRSAYRWTAEDSVYVRPDLQRRGIGRALLEDLVRRGRESGLHTLVALVSADQEPSLRLHEKLGFSRAGLLEQTGKKFGRWLDVIFMQLMLGKGEAP